MQQHTSEECGRVGIKYEITWCNLENVSLAGREMDTDMSSSCEQPDTSKLDSSNPIIIDDEPTRVLATAEILIEGEDRNATITALISESSQDLVKYEGPSEISVTMEIAQESIFSASNVATESSVSGSPCQIPLQDLAIIEVLTEVSSNGDSLQYSDEIDNTQQTENIAITTVNESMVASEITTIQQFHDLPDFDTHIEEINHSIYPSPLRPTSEAKSETELEYESPARNVNVDSIFECRKRKLEQAAEHRAKGRFLRWQQEKISLQQAIDETLKDHIELHEAATALRMRFEDESAKLRIRVQYLVQEELRRQKDFHSGHIQNTSYSDAYSGSATTNQKPRYHPQEIDAQDGSLDWMSKQSLKIIPNDALNLNDKTLDNEFIYDQGTDQSHDMEFDVKHETTDDPTKGPFKESIRLKRFSPPTKRVAIVETETFVTK